MNHLHQLESESISILREAVASARKPVMLQQPPRAYAQHTPNLLLDRR